MALDNDDTDAPARAGDTDALIKEARRRFKRSQDVEAIARNRFVDDLKFANGDAYNNYQWPDKIYSDRSGQNRPAMTINKVRQHNLQIINDARQNKTSIKIVATGDGATYESAQVYSAVCRHIEYISNAQQIYTTATRFQVQAGIGYWRVETDWADDQSFDQEIFLRPCKNPLSIYLDPDIIEADGSDARYAFVFEDMPPDEFKSLYPKFKDLSDASGFDADDDWCKPDSIRVAEYWRKSEIPDWLVAYVEGQDPTTGEPMMKVERASDMPPGKFDLVKLASGTKRRRITGYKVERFKIAGDKIIERTDWLGKYIPIVRVPGEETNIDGILDRKGHTRAMLDPQRNYNFWPLSLETPIPTPDGWTKMGDIEVGDMIFDSDGLPTRVRGMSEVFTDRKCYRVAFDDGTHIVADAEHPWVIEERGKPKSGGFHWHEKKLTTAELVAGKHFIYTTKPLDLPEADLPLDPYVLGVWLGDGRSNGGEIAASVDDAPGMVAALRAAGVDAGDATPNSSGMRIPIYGIVGTLRNLGVVNNKHIPNLYLRASAAQRLALLQGLMDTDGGINKKTRQCTFDNSNPVLFAGVVELIRSLGIKAFTRKIEAKERLFPSGNTYSCAASERVGFSTDTQVFRMERKASINAPRNYHPRRTKRFGIKSVVEVPSVPVRCVSIESPSHLFLAGVSMVPTHNTSEAAAQVALQTKVPYMAPVAAISGYETIWANANVQNPAILPYKHTDEDGNSIPAPERTQPPVMAQGYIQGMQIAQEELRMSSGQYQAEMGAPGNEKSGVAITARQRQADNATYHYVDHLAMAIRFTGKILIDLIPKVYDTPRVRRIMAEDGTESDVTIDVQAKGALAKQGPATPQGQTPADAKKEAVKSIFNPTVGKYDVEADVGPGFATRRQEAFNAFTQIAAQNKEFMNIGGDLMWKAADFPMADTLAERWRRSIPPHLLGEGPSPEQQAMQQQLQQMQQVIAANGEHMQELERKLKDQSADIAEKAERVQIDAISAGTEAYDAETKRLSALKDALPLDADALKVLIRATIMDALNTPDPSLATDGLGQPDPMALAPPPVAPEAVPGGMQTPLPPEPPESVENPPLPPGGPEA